MKCWTICAAFGLVARLPASETLPHKTTVNAIASGGYNYATNANQADIDIIANSIDSQNANLLILVPAGRKEDTVALPVGAIGGTLRDARHEFLRCAERQHHLYAAAWAEADGAGIATGGTARTDLLTMGLDGTSVYQPGFGAEQISIATPSIGWSRSNIGLGTLRREGRRGLLLLRQYLDLAAREPCRC